MPRQAICGVTLTMHGAWNDWLQQLSLIILLVEAVEIKITFTVSRLWKQ